MIRPPSVKEGDLQMTHLTQCGLVDQGSHIMPLVEAVEEEEVAEEEVDDHLEPQEIQTIKVMAQS